jgi:hypothetical protein
MTLAPIALFTYNRLWHTQQTVAALQKNKESAESDLFIFCDGAKTAVDKAKVDEVRNYLKTISGFKSIKIYEQATNRGLANSIIAGVTQVVNEFNRVIVLEDDMVTSPHFLRFMNDGLELYENQPEVACIHAYRYPIGPVETPFFIRGADCWGWGTWKRAWDNFNANGSELLAQLQAENLIKAFNHQNAFPYDKMLKDQIAGKNNSWAIRWKASAFLKNQYTLYYKASLLKNIGNDDSGTHSQTTNQFDIEFPETYEGLQLQKVEENPVIAARISDFYKKTRPTFLKRLKAKLFK